MSEVVSAFEQALKDLFPTRSRLNRDLRPRTGKMLCIYGDLVDSLEKDGRAVPMLHLVKQQLPKDVYLLDNVTNGGVIFPIPIFTNTGLGSLTDAFGIIFGSDEWESKPEGSPFPRIQALFTKDPTTWAVTCKIVEDNYK